MVWVVLLERNMYVHTHTLTHTSFVADILSRVSQKSSSHNQITHRGLTLEQIFHKGGTDTHSLVCVTFHQQRVQGLRRDSPQDSRNIAAVGLHTLCQERTLARPGSVTVDSLEQQVAYQKFSNVSA